MPGLRSSRGFTLLEMVVAIGIFALIAAISYSALNNFLEARTHINRENAQIRDLQTAFVLLEQDLRYAVNRPVRDGYGDPEPAFLGGPGDGLADGERLRLTTLRPVPGSTGSRVVRVAWRLNDGELIRVSWPVLDRDVDSREYRRRLLSGVDDVGLTFYSYGGDSEDELRTDSEWADSRLPEGVEVSILLQGRPSFQRIFQLAGGP